nr:hypothetical protein [Bacillus toyonensis]
MYLDCTLDIRGNTVDFYLSINSGTKSAKRFFIKALATFYTSKPSVLIVDKK